MNKKRMVLCLMAMACVLTFSAQTERTIAFDNLYHFIENLTAPGSVHGVRLTFLVISADNQHGLWQ